jgi:hypothetical protein
MKRRDLIRLLIHPFCSRSLSRMPELTARMVDLGLVEPAREVTAINVPA